ncbi:MAG: hypothetical protein PHO01_12960 [Desulfotomaculaceae bacterium]|nr:hypothetical protein [Desulfotomaculaceae bacterium]
MKIIGIIGIFIIAGFLMHLFFHWLFRSADLSGTSQNKRLYAYMPVYDSDERHKITVKASPEKIFEAIHRFDMGDSSIVKFFLFLRGLFSRSSDNNPDNPEPLKFSLEKMTTSGGMILLEEIENKEVVLGLGGQFWKIKPTEIHFTGMNDFVNFNQTDNVKVAWNLYIEEGEDGTASLSTETRNLCLGQKAKSAFRIYWWIIRPYSGWIRVAILKMIKAQAEKMT